jgi:DNA-binding NarL/FixJ family response regulator
VIQHQPRAAVASRPARILIADDERDCVIGLSRRLRQHGYVVLPPVSSLLTLFGEIRRQHPDAVLLDIFFRRERLNALLRLRQLLKACPRTVFIVNTGIDDPSLVTLAMANGAKGFLTKLDHDELFVAIEAALVGETYISAYMRRLVANMSRERPPRLTPAQERMLRLLQSKRKHVSLAAELGVPQRTFDRRQQELARALGLDHRETYHINWAAVEYEPPTMGGE